MDGRYTVDYLLDPAHEDDLRRLSEKCFGRYRCGSRYRLAGADCEACSAPDSTVGSLPDIAEQLVGKCVSLPGGYMVLVASIKKLWAACKAEPIPVAPWVLLTPGEKIVCCLLALLPEKVRIDK